VGLASAVSLARDNVTGAAMNDSSKETRHLPRTHGSSALADDCFGGACGGGGLGGAGPSGAGPSSPDEPSMSSTL
jgi:uncharacterized low-complexity protein